MTLAQLDYVAATVRLRPPRFAVVLPASPVWHRSVLFALARCEQRWGGPGALLIPSRSEVDRAVWSRLSVAFDPDHVLMLRRTFGEQMLLDPDTPWPTIDGQAATDEQKVMLASYRLHPVPVEQQAVRRLAEASSPFWSRLQDDDEREAHLQLSFLDEAGSRDLPVSPEGVQIGTEVWASLEGADAIDESARVWLSSRLGPTVATQQLNANDLDAEVLASLVSQALDITKYNPWGEPGLWGSSTTGTTTLLPWTARDKRWIVVGDTSDDCLLAHSLARTAHDAIWLPASWAAEGSLGRSAARTIVSAALAHATGEPLRVVSASMSASAARALIIELLGGWISKDDRIEERSLEDVPEPGSYTLVAIQQDYERSLALPVHVSDQGDRTLVTRLPAQVPSDLSLHQLAPHGWVIDVEAADWNIPRARSLPASNLEQEEVWRERVRDARDGLSVMSASFGFVPAGASVEAATAQPKLTFPGLETWARSLARVAGFELRRSDAGHQAELLAKLAGTRRALGELLAGRAPFFEAFLSDTDKSSQRYPEDLGCVIRGDGYPRFEFLQGVLQAEPQWTRDFLDDLTTRGLVSRGLILRCLLCSHVQHATSVDASGCGPCARCSANLTLRQASWKQPVAEPHWYYDLHPLLRRVLREHGDVPLLAETRLREQRRQLQGAAEFELVRDGRPIEIDLLCVDREQVVVGEAKLDAAITNAELRKKTSALMTAARVLKADELLFASATDTEWGSGQQQMVRDLIETGQWQRGRVPKVTFMSGLRRRDNLT